MDMKTIPKAADRLVPAPKNIEDVLPEMIRIASEGDEFKRIVEMLVQQGWTREDVWRESKKLTMASDMFKSALLNRFDDIVKHKQVNTSWTHMLKWCQTHFKRLKRQSKSQAAS